MARNQPKAETSPSPQSSNSQVSLMKGPSDVPQPGPSKDIVIGKVESRSNAEPAPAPVVTYGDDGSITIK